MESPLNPFELAQHLEDDHYYAPELVETLDANMARQLHLEEHAGYQWAHNHKPAK
jgi:hypothetical protein